MTEQKLEELVKQSLGAVGAKEAASALRVYLPAKERWDKAKKEFFAGLKIGSIVFVKPSYGDSWNYPGEIIDISTDDGRKYRPYTLKNLNSGDTVEVGVGNLTPYDEKDAFRARNCLRYLNIVNHLDQVFNSGDAAALKKIEAALKKT